MWSSAWQQRNRTTLAYSIQVKRSTLSYLLPSLNLKFYCKVYKGEFPMANKEVLGALKAGGV